MTSAARRISVGVFAGEKLKSLLTIFLAGVIRSTGPGLLYTHRAERKENNPFSNCKLHAEDREPSLLHKEHGWAKV